jgi:hypothetical protein
MLMLLPLTLNTSCVQSDEFVKMDPKHFNAVCSAFNFNVIFSFHILYGTSYFICHFLYQDILV